MDEQSSVTNLKDFIPKSVDDIVRARRDECRLAWATDEEVERYKGDLQKTGATVRSTLGNWNILMFHLIYEEATTSVPFLVGTLQDTGQPRITSAVKAVDPTAGLVRTMNSLYSVVGPREPEPDMDVLIHICVWLNASGVGPDLGVPGFFY